MPTDDSRLRASALAETLRESLGAACVVGLGVGVVTGMALARVPGPAIVQAETAELFTITVTLLSALMTVIGVVLSVLVVAQQLASQQFSPRAIRTTLRDRVTRRSLGGLFGYVGYMIGVVEGLDRVTDPLGVAVGMALSVVALGVVAYLIQHISNGFRAGELVERIGRDTADAIARMPAGQQGTGRHAGSEGLRPAMAVPDHARAVHVRRSGYLQDAALVALAEDLADRGVTLRLSVAMGDFVGAGLAVAWAWPDAASDTVDVADVETVLDAHLRLGQTRTTEQEVGSGVQQLADIALKALSPAVNDPYTAVQAVNASTHVLQLLAEQPQEWLVGSADGTVRVLIPRPTVWDLVDGVVAPVRRVAGGFPGVMEALVVLLRTIVATRPADADRVIPHLDAIEAEADRGDLLDVDLQAVRAVIDRARRECLTGRADGPLAAAGSRHGRPAPAGLGHSDRALGHSDST